MTIAWQTPGAIAYSASGGSSIAAAYPTGCAEGDKLLLLVGMKPGTANGGGVTTPSGWSLVASQTGAGGYGTSLAADTGNTNLWAYERTVPAGGLSGSLTVSLSGNGVAWAIMLRLTTDNGAWDSVAGATGSDATAGNVSVAFASNPGVTAGDFVVGAMCIPTDVTTPAQFTSEAITQAGVTFGAVVEVGEPDSSTGNDIGGLVLYAPVSSGTATGNPSMTATASGTTTNVRGPALFIRVREGAKTASGRCVGLARCAAVARGSKGGSARCAPAATVTAVAAGQKGAQGRVLGMSVALAMARGMKAAALVILAGASARAHARGVKAGTGRARGMCTCMAMAAGGKVGSARATAPAVAAAVAAGFKGWSARAVLRAVVAAIARGGKTEPPYITLAYTARVPRGIATVARLLPQGMVGAGNLPLPIAVAARRVPPVSSLAGRVPVALAATARSRRPVDTP